MTFIGSKKEIFFVVSTDFFVLKHFTDLPVAYLTVSKA